MAKKQPTKAEKDHMHRVRSLGCIICGRPPEVHHITNGTMGKKASHYETIPLCFNHHSAQTPLPFGESVHKGTKSFEAKYGTQEELLKRTLERLNNIINDV